MSTTPDPGPLIVNIRIEPLTPERYGEDFKLLHEFLGTMRCCCCIPNSCGESEAGWTKKREKWPADKLSLSAVSTSHEQGRGICPPFWHGRPSTCTVRRTIRDQVMVEESLRRRGIGTQLMNWVEIPRVARRDDAFSARLKETCAGPLRAWVRSGPTGRAERLLLLRPFSGRGAEMMYAASDAAAEPVRKLLRGNDEQAAFRRRAGRGVGELMCVDF